jgi:hypothetical protein
MYAILKTVTFLKRVVLKYAEAVAGNLLAAAHCHSVRKIGYKDHVKTVPELR